MKDYYRILELHEAASPEVIDAAYRRLARRFHPDVNPSADATQRMKELNEAFDVLSDPSRRADYDRRRAELSRKLLTPSGSDSSQQPIPQRSWLSVFVEAVAVKFGESMAAVGRRWRLLVGLASALVLVGALARVAWLLNTNGFAIIPFPTVPLLVAVYSSPTPTPTETAVPTRTPTGTATVLRASQPSAVALVLTSTPIPSPTARPVPPPSPTTAPAQTIADCTPAVESQIDGQYGGWYRETVFPLVNGQTWQQAKVDGGGHSPIAYLFKPKVTIFPAATGCTLQVAGDNAIVLVKRIR